MLTLSVMAIALAATGPTDTAMATPDSTGETGVLSVAALAEGRNAEAIAQLEASGALASNDPAQLINLGIAYAREGEDVTARALFEAALKSPEPIELETADGSLTTSVRLARKALRMLDAGAFASAPNRVTLRQ